MPTPAPVAVPPIGGSTISVNAAKLKAELEAAFPTINQPRRVEVYNRRLIASGSRWSEHAWGNALDIFGTFAFLNDQVYPWLLSRRNNWNGGLGFGELLWQDANHRDHIHVAPNPLYHKQGGRYFTPPGLRQRPNSVPALPVFPGGMVPGAPEPGTAALGVEIELQMWMNVWGRAPGSLAPTKSVQDVSAWVRPSNSYAARQMDSIIPGEMVVTFNRAYHWPTVELQPVLLMRNSHTGEVEVNHPLGTYYVNKDQRIGEEDADDDTLPTFRLWCVDGLWLLNRQVGRTVTVAAADNVVDKVVELIQEAISRTPFEPQILVNPSSATSGVDRVWEVQKRTTYLEIIQTMLADLGYGSLYCGTDGSYRAGVFLPPLHRPVAGHYSSERIPGRWSRIGYPVQSTRQWGLPNKWVFYVDNPEPAAPVPDPSNPDTWYEVENRYTGDESITGSLHTVIDSIPVDADSAATLKAAGDRYAELEIQNANQTVTLKTLPSPYFWHNNLLYLSIKEVGIGKANPAALTFWRVPFDGQLMTLRASLINSLNLG